MMGWSRVECHGLAWLVPLPFPSHPILFTFEVSEKNGGGGGKIGWDYAFYEGSKLNNF